MIPTQVLCTILTYAADEAMRTGNLEISVDHLLLGILRHGKNNACRTLSGLGVNLDELKEYLDSHLFRHSSIDFTKRDEVKPSRDVENILAVASYEASAKAKRSVDESHLLLAISNCPNSKGAAFFKELGFTRSDFETGNEPQPRTDVSYKKTSGTKTFTYLGAASSIKS